MNRKTVEAVHTHTHTHTSIHYKTELVDSLERESIQFNRKNSKHENALFVIYARDG